LRVIAIAIIGATHAARRVLDSSYMRAFGVPLWTLVLVACAVVPLLVKVWIDAEQRRTKKRTAALLQGFGAAKSGRTASIEHPSVDSRLTEGDPPS
jgi:hypothetical protein